MPKLLGIQPCSQMMMRTRMCEKIHLQNAESVFSGPIDYHSQFRRAIGSPGSLGIAARWYCIWSCGCGYQRWSHQEYLLYIWQWLRMTVIFYLKHRSPPERQTVEGDRSKKFFRGLLKPQLSVGVTRDIYIYIYPLTTLRGPIIVPSGKQT